jgi:hypothetical protein
MHAFDIIRMNAEIKERTKYTPDFPVLQDLKEHLFFIVNDFQRGCPNHVHLGKAHYGTRAFSFDGFECYRECLTDKVIPFYERRIPDVVDKAYFARLKGEVWSVKTNQIPVLDTEMRNGVQFVRRRISLLAPDKDHVCIDNGQYDYVSGLPLPYHLAGFKHYVSGEKVFMLQAWMYVAMRDYWNPLIDGLVFDRLEMYDSDRVWLRKFYRFNKRRNE